MPTYSYRARTKSGQVIESLVDAPSPAVARDTLEGQGLIVIEITPKRERGILVGRVAFRDLVIVFRQLSAMAGATVPIVTALRIITEQTEHLRLRLALAAVTSDVSGGSKLSDAFARFPDLFSSYIVSMVRTGELSGKLDETLTQLADQLERDYTLRQRLFSAMIYPAFVLVGLIVVGAIFTLKILPQLLGVVKDIGVSLPLATRLLIRVVDLAKIFSLPILIILSGGIVALLASYRTRGGRWVIDGIIVRLPIMGQLVRQIAVVRMTRSLATLLSAGIPLPQGLSITAETCGNVRFMKLLHLVRREVEDGRAMALPLKGSSLVPPMVSHMVAVGEATGKLDTMLAKVAQFYAAEVERTVDNLVALIEPVVIVLLGIVVGGIISAILLPIYRLATSL